GHPAVREKSVPPEQRIGSPTVALATERNAKAAWYPCLRSLSIIRPSGTPFWRKGADGAAPSRNQTKKRDWRARLRPRLSAIRRSFGPDKPVLFALEHPVVP